MKLIAKAALLVLPVMLLAIASVRAGSVGKVMVEAVPSYVEHESISSAHAILDSGGLYVGGRVRIAWVPKSKGGHVHIDVIAIDGSVLASQCVADIRSIPNKLDHTTPYGTTFRGLTTAQVAGVRVEYHPVVSPALCGS